MTGAAQKISAIAGAIALGLAIVAAPQVNTAFAQNEAEPESSPIEEPQAEPTVWTPVTAGEAERGAPAATTVESPSPEPTPTSAPEPTSTPAAPAAATHSTISREKTPKGSKTRASKSTEAASATPIATTSTGTTPKQEHNASVSGAGPQIVPENSPFAGMNFGNQKGPTNIKSDTATLDYKNKAVLFSGHVHAVQAGGDLTSNTLRVQYGQDFNDIKMMYADGNVRMSQGTRWITSDHAVLNQTTHILTFTGNPVVHDGQDQITGSVVAVDLVSGKSTVENPRVVIFPRESKNPDNVDTPAQ